MYSERGTFCFMIYIVVHVRPAFRKRKEKEGVVSSVWKGKVDRKRWMVTLIGFGNFVFNEFL